MTIKLRALPFVLATAFFFSLAVPAPSQAKSEIYKNWLGVAIKGYDPVAYYQAGQAVKGTDTYGYKWKGAKWRFSSAEHRDLFAADPDNYAPQYGGYCAWAVSQGTTAGVDPQNAWNIIDGKLYLNYNTDIQRRWAEDISGNIQKADANWPGVLE